MHHTQLPNLLPPRPNTPRTSHILPTILLCILLPTSQFLIQDVSMKSTQNIAAMAKATTSLSTFIYATQCISIGPEFTIALLIIWTKKRFLGNFFVATKSAITQFERAI